MLTAYETRAEPNRLKPQASLDLRPRRDLWSKRIWQDTVAKTCRVVGLAASDCISASIAVWATAALMNTPDILIVWPGILVLTVLGQATAGTYAGRRESTKYERVALGVLIAAVTTHILYSGLGPDTLTLHSHVPLVLCTGALVVLTRGLGKLALQRAYRRGIGITNMLVVGSWAEAWEVTEHYRDARHLGVRVVGHLSPTPEGDPTALGGLERLGEIIEAQNVSRVTISAKLPGEELRDLVRACFMHGTAVSIVPGILNTFHCRFSGGDVLGWPLLQLEAPRLQLLQVVLKRTVDLVLAGVGILLLAPLFLALAVAIRLDTPGPVFFRQRRPGAGGKPFNMYKFRSMRTDAEAVLRADPALYASYLANDCKLPEKEDPRTTRLGRFIRRTSLDELPQLFNVLRGDMSLVGPRPVLPEQIDEYGNQTLTFLGVKPGITGFWQIKGRSTIRYPERAELDIHYVTSWSLLLDLKILFQTIPAVLQRRGAH